MRTGCDEDAGRSGRENEVTGWLLSLERGLLSALETEVVSAQGESRRRCGQLVSGMWEDEYGGCAQRGVYRVPQSVKAGQTMRGAIEDVASLEQEREKFCVDAWHKGGPVECRGERKRDGRGREVVRM